jgi:hypothetical protein
MKVVLMVSAAAMGLMAGQVYAAPYHLIGSGVGSCGTWTADRRQPDSLAAIMGEQWVVGFLSGVGFTGLGVGLTPQPLDPLNGVDAQAVWAWVDNFCQAYPLASVADAAAKFVNDHLR